MTTSVRHLLVLAVTALLLAGCGGAGGPAGDATGDDATDPGTSSAPAPSGDASTPSGPTGQAVADLAERLGVDPAAIEVVAVDEVTWRDGSRGCAEPGTMYAQALVDGTRITLRADGTDHEYHSGGGQRPFLCEDPTE